MKFPEQQISEGSVKWSVFILGKGFSWCYSRVYIKVNVNLEKISNWVNQWKMSFNLDKSKQAQEVIFSRKTQRVNHPAIFNIIPVVRSSC